VRSQANSAMSDAAAQSLRLHEMPRSFGKTIPAVVGGRSKPNVIPGTQLLQSRRSSNVKYDPSRTLTKAATSYRLSGSERRIGPATFSSYRLHVIFGLARRRSPV
jgi:hypothetical protein